MCPELTELNLYFLPFRIFEQVALALKTELPWYFSLYWYDFIIQDFWINCACPESRVYPELTVFNIHFYHSGFLSNLRFPWNFSLYWNIFYHSGFLSNLRLPWKQSCPEIFYCIDTSFIIQDFEQHALALKFFTVLTYFYHSGFLSNLRLPWKQNCPEIFRCIDIFLSFRIFEQLALALKTELPWNFSLYWYIFYHSGFLSNLRLPWKQSLIWINCFEHIFFIIQDFWATCVCPENRVCPELTVLNRFATRGGICLPEIFKTLHGNFDIHRNSQRKMEFLILIIVKKSLIWIFLCPTG